ncbi:hypothetical protein Indivirus_1_108 [Indivirus ILV1]|uniref:Uncharacterized protein n=1 Tax=Indivirus ILV1 TaxID=1977633 RepID=A0A1V0SCQ1_9VIRU|nr:hypothetical protein Indivirus_1_108 [Indivirus ILV1]
MLSSENIANIILHIIILATFIIIFFFTYGSYLEGKIVKQQMEYITDDLVGDIKVVAPELAVGLKKSLETLPKLNLDEADKVVEENNSKLRTKSLLIIGAVILVGIGIVYGMSRYFNFPLKDIIIVNIVSLIVVGLTYFIFSTFFIAYYRSADPSFVKKKILESLKK